MRKEQVAQRIVIGLICLGVTTMVAALAIKHSSLDKPSAVTQPSAEPVSISKAASPDRWREVDDFKKGLPALLANSVAAPDSFNITNLANKLSLVRVGGFAVCADEEISAEQYIQLSEVATKLEDFKSVTVQLNKLLDTPTGITDCQFRVLDGATTKPAAINK